ncbi:unnamed protein product [Mytilus coruscus]|uniref:Transposase Tc1-like domain-containing protein n=1 Tax=Mytilus coruscus TaxID=42192 RepID=A0A6J8DL35_MYTCO|nr:unnamed protein product [Mytilus coruscus]
MSRLRQTGSSNDSPRSRRPRETRLRQDRQIRFTHLKDRFLPDTITARQTPGRNNLRIFAQTVRNRLREAGLCSLRPVVRAILKQRYRTARLRWANARLFWNRVSSPTATKETEDPPSSLKDLKDKVYTLMMDEAHILFASPPKPKRLSSTFKASCGISQDSVTSHNSFPESGHMAFSLQIINEGIATSASEKVANNQISGFRMSSFSDQLEYKDFDIFDSSLGRLVPTCDKSFSSLLGIKPVDGLRLTQPVGKD